MTDRPSISVNGEALTLHKSGAAYWAARKTLLVADLHFEKASSYAAKGLGFLPPYDTRETQKRLMKLIDLFGAERLISLGDSFHDDKAGQRLSTEDRNGFAALARQVDLIWIRGNHDPELPRGLAGDVTDEMQEGGLVLRHEPQPAPSVGEVAGHLHPVALVKVRGRRMRRRAFICDGARLVLPSFGALTGGLDVLDPAFQPLFPASFHAHMIGRETIVPVRSDRLIPERA